MQMLRRKSLHPNVLALVLFPACAVVSPMILQCTRIAEKVKHKHCASNGVLSRPGMQGRVKKGTVRQALAALGDGPHNIPASGHLAKTGKTSHCEAAGFARK